MTLKSVAMSPLMTDAGFERLCAPRRVEIREGASLTDLMRLAIPDPILRAHAVILMEGEVIGRALWHSIRPKLHTHVQIGLKPAGDTGKKILKTILVVAVVVVATWIAGPNFGAAGASYLFGSQTAAAVASAALSLAANFAINSILPPPGFSGTGGRIEQDPTYSLQGTRNQARPRQTVEVVWGHHRYTPSLMSEQYQEPVGDDIYLSFIACFGIGNYEVSDLRIGETPLSEFSDVVQQPCLTLDAPEQTLIPGDFTQDGLSVALSTTFDVRRTAANVSDIEVFLSFPRGLGTRDDEGKPQAVSVTVEIEYREVNDDNSTGGWIIAAAGNGAEADADLQANNYGGRAAYFDSYSDLGNYELTFPSGGAFDLGKTYSRSDTKPFADRIKFAVPPGKQYDVRVRRTSARNAELDVANDVNWASLNSWSTDSLTPDPRFATIAFRLKASEELSGIVSNLNGLPKKIIPTFSGDPLSFDPALATAADWDNNETTSRNPADIVLDINRGPHTDNPLPDSDIYWPDFCAFWIWCYENDFTFDLPIVQDMARNELEELVAAAGRARLFRGTDGKKHIAIDRPRTEGPKQLITANTVRNFVAVRSFSAPVHALRIPFINSEDEYRDDELFVYRDGYAATADSENNVEAATLFEEIRLPGRVVPDTVWKEGKFYLKSAELMTTHVSCEMDWEAKSLTLGDYIRVQHPVMNEVAVSGRIVAVDGAKVILEKPVPFRIGKNYVMRYRRIIDHGDGTGSITAEGVIALTNPGETTDSVTLDESLPEGVTLSAGLLTTVGIAGLETFEGLIKNLQPSGPKHMAVELVAYLPERLTVPDAPARTADTPANWVRPPAPVLIGATATPDHISVRFDVPSGYQSGIAGFRTRYFINTTDSAQPNIGPRLGAEDRVLSLSPGTPGQLYDVEIQTEDLDGRLSLPLIVSDLEASDFVPAPANAAAVGRVETDSGGVKIPVVDVSVDAVESTIIETLIIERRPANSVILWSSPTIAPADAPSKTLSGLLPGQAIDIRLAWRDVRGAVTADADKVILTNIAVPNEFTARDTHLVNGLTSVDVTGRVQYIGSNGRINNALAVPPALLSGNTYSVISGTLTVNETSILVSARSIQTPAGVISYNAGTVSGLTSDTLYFIYVDDPDLAGGTKPYGAVTDQTQISSNLGRIYIGRATTAPDGAGDGGGSFDDTYFEY